MYVVPNNLTGERGPPVDVDLPGTSAEAWPGWSGRDGAHRAAPSSASPLREVDSEGGERREEIILKPGRRRQRTPPTPPIKLVRR